MVGIPSWLDKARARAQQHPVAARLIDPLVRQLQARGKLDEASVERGLDRLERVFSGAPAEAPRPTKVSTPAPALHALSGGARAAVLASLGPAAGPLVASADRILTLAKTGSTVRARRELSASLEEATRALHDAGLSSGVLHHAARVQRELTGRLEGMHGGTRIDAPAWQEIHALHQGLLTELAAERGAFLTSSGAQAWSTLRLMRPAEKKLELLRREDPALHQLVHQRREGWRRLDQVHEAQVRAAGLTPARARVMGRMRVVGRDASGERYIVESSGRATRLRDHLDQLELNVLETSNPLLHRTLVERGVCWRTLKSEVELRILDARLAALAGAPATEAAQRLRATLTDRRARWPELDSKTRLQTLGLAGAERRRLGGRLVYVVPEEGSGQKLVHDYDGEVLSPEAYVAKQEAAKQAAARLAAAGELDDRTLRKLPRVPDEVVEGLEGAETHHALTDDLSRASPQTRILPAREYEGRPLVTSGRFKGYFVDSLQSAVGPRLEGGAYRFQPSRGTATKVAEGTDGKEPYVTVVERTVNGTRQTLLQLQLPSGRGEWTAVRGKVRALSRELPTAVVTEAGGQRPVYTFPLSLFNSVREATGGVLLSSSAARALETHYQKQAALHQATRDDQLGEFTAEAIGGFVREVRDARGQTTAFRLTREQQRQLALLEATGHRAIVPMDVGMGKTLVAIADLWRLYSNGFVKPEGEESRFLVVVPRDLKRNFTHELEKFLLEEGATPTSPAEARSQRARRAQAKEMIKRIDLVSYGEFESRMSSEKLNGKDYAAVVFDEAHQFLVNTQNKVTRAALKLDAKRCVLLTATAGKRFNRDFHTLQTIATRSVDLDDPAARAAFRAEQRSFDARYRNPRFGGRIPRGAKTPAERAAETAVRDAERDALINGILRAPSRFEDDEVKLPPSTRGRRFLQMAPEVEARYRKEVAAYRDATRALAKSLGAPDDALAEGAPRPALEEAKRVLLEGRDRAFVELTTALVNRPEDFITGAGYPKFRQAARDVWSFLLEDKNNKTALWTHDRKSVTASARYLSTARPEAGASDPELAGTLGVAGKLHAAVLDDEIHLFRDGVALDQLDGYALPFRRRAYQHRDPLTGEVVKSKEEAWQQFVIDQILTRSDVATATFFAPSYRTGFNLQHAFNEAIVYDETPFATEARQQTGRLVRTGQARPGHEYSYVAHFANPTDESDVTQDQLRSMIQEADARDFERVFLGASQHNAAGDWLSMQTHRTAERALETELLELALSPDFDRLRRRGRSDG